MLSRRTLLLLAALGLAVAPAWPQARGAAPAAPAFDSVMATVLRVDWQDPLNPRYVNLGDDLFLLDTQQGVKLWDAAARTLADPAFAPALGAVRLEKLDRGQRNGARLGDAPGGTALLSVGDRRTPHALLWWDGAARRFAATLPLAPEQGLPGLLRLGPHHLLLCTHGNKGSAVVRLRQGGGAPALAWADGDDAAARQALQASGVIGPVRGFGTLAEASPARPVVFDVSHCGWEMRHAPAELRRHVEPATRSQVPQLKPYFLADGRILMGEASYHDGQYWRDLNPPLLWDAAARRWTPIEPTRGRGGQASRGGQEEPVVTLAFQSEVVEFLDTRTMRWSRSIERLPEGYGAHVEPLRSGRALVLMRETAPSGRGVLGEVTPMRGEAVPPGHLALARSRHDEHIVLDGGRLMLAGNGERWDPSTRVELIDPQAGQSRLLASLPQPLVSPAGVALRDGSALVFGGLPARCGPSDAPSCAGPEAQPSYRYLPGENRWQALPALRVPYERGPWWQTGNSDLASQWTRQDALVRADGRLVWIEGTRATAGDEDALLPQSSRLMAWSPQAGDQPGRTLARLRKARTQASLVELADGRVAAIGGFAQRESVALERDCIDCPDSFVSIGPFEPARSTEVLDESDAANPIWRTGPLANHGGGRAMKLANGRIFKLSLAGDFDEQGLRAEVADASFTRWSRLPPPPLDAAARVVQVAVAGNRVVILADKGPTVAWDDAQGRWLVWRDWPAAAAAERPVSILRSGDDARALVRYRRSFTLTPWPR